MDFTRYQQLASRTLKEQQSIELTLMNMAMGIAGESGEAVDYLKKVMFQGHPFDVEKLASELGDVLWYIAGMCTTLKISLEDLAAYNIKKLEDRYPEGFSEKSSIERKVDNSDSVNDSVNKSVNDSVNKSVNDSLFEDSGGNSAEVTP